MYSAGVGAGRSAVTSDLREHQRHRRGESHAGHAGHAGNAGHAAAHRSQSRAFPECTALLTQVNPEPETEKLGVRHRR